MYMLVMFSRGLDAYHWSSYVLLFIGIQPGGRILLRDYAVGDLAQVQSSYSCQTERFSLKDNMSK